jgi:CDP-6-deoxy-D-xylo-4-hexulose-3-dehydrase
LRKIHYAGRVYDDEEIKNGIDSVKEFWLTYGKYSKEFEKRFSKFLNIKHTTLVNSGSSANLVAVSALMSNDLKDKKVNKGNTVICISTAFPTSITPIIQNGLIPLFVDIDINTLNINLYELEKTLIFNPKILFVANTLGNPINLDTIVKFCKDNNIYLILDNCDSLGSKYNNKHLDEYADISTHSFFPAHTITAGYAGAVCTNNSKLNDIILSLVEWGRKYHCINCNGNCKNRFNRKESNLPENYDCRYIFSNAGYNLRPTDIQASILCAQMNKLEDFIIKRKKNYNLIRKNLEDFSNYFIFQDAEKNSNPSWFGFSVTLKNNINFTRNELIQYLENNNIETRLIFAGAIHKQPLFENLIEKEDYIIIGKLENSEKVMNDSFFIGVYPGINKDDIDYITNCLKNFIDITNNKADRVTISKVKE